MHPKTNPPIIPITTRAASHLNSSLAILVLGEVLEVGAVIGSLLGEEERLFESSDTTLAVEVTLLVRPNVRHSVLPGCRAENP